MRGSFGNSLQSSKHLAANVGLRIRLKCNHICLMRGKMISGDARLITFQRSRMITSKPNSDLAAMVHQHHVISRDARLIIFSRDQP